MADAREIARLVTHLDGILETLNTNIYRYREAKAAEFNSLYGDVINGTPDLVAVEIRKIILSHISSRYTELHGFTFGPAHGADRPHPQEAVQEPGEIKAASSRATNSEARQEHESDLSGVFTPQFLPLLDASKASATSSQPQSPTSPDSTRSGITSPVHKDAAHRRSALRRSSSTSKSPRKVRFDIGGENSDSTLSDENPLSFGTIDKPVFSMSWSSTFPPSLLDDPDEAPPPKKVSSVERLRQLGRRPYKTQEESDADAPPSSFKENLHDATEAIDSAYGSSSQASKNPLPGIGVLRRSNRPTIDLKESESNFGSTALDNDEGVFPEINTKKFKKKRPSSSHIQPTSTIAAQTPPAQQAAGTTNSAVSMSRESPGPDTSEAIPSKHEESKLGKKAAKQEQKARRVDNDDGLFDMEDENGRTKSSLQQQPPISEGLSDHELEGLEADDEVLMMPPTKTTNPAVPVVTSTQSADPPPQKSLLAEAVGSYKGNRLVMPVVKNQDVYAEAASMGDFSSFVGGIDGTSGVDEGDLNSFRASVTQPPAGSPKSFSERLLMEDAISAMQSQQSSGQLPFQPQQML